ncbi:MAG: outer membrane beta-barrel protein [Vicinamibacterales bacterium]
MTVIRATSLAAVLTFSTVSSAMAQAGGWLSVNATMNQPATKSVTQRDQVPYRSEFFTSSGDYTMKGKPSFDIAGGVRFTRQLGIGIAVSQFADNEPAQISFSVPHPALFNRPANGSGETSALEQKDTAVHIEARYTVNTPRANVSVFAGPSHFSSTRELVSDYTYRELLLTPSLTYTVTYTGATTTKDKMSAWGLNVGADVGYFFTEKAGVGMLVRYSKANVDLPNEMTLTSSDSDKLGVGGLSIGGGLRLRF